MWKFLYNVFPAYLLFLSFAVLMWRMDRRQVEVHLMGQVPHLDLSCRTYLSDGSPSSTALTATSNYRQNLSLATPHSPANCKFFSVDNYGFYNSL